jgi:hypothetical protein
MPDSNPYKSEGLSFTYKATAAVTGARFVKISGNRTGGGEAGLSTDLANVYQCSQVTASGGVAVGVSMRDCANGALGQAHAGPGLIVPVTAGATLTAGTKVQSDATGQAIPWDGTVASVPVGTVMTGAASGALAEIKLTL